MSRITLLLPDLEVGGAQRVMLLLAREFIEFGHSVDLVLLTPSGPLLSDIPEGVKIVDLEAKSFGFGRLGFMASSIVRLAAWIKREAPDVLLSTITGTNLVALLAQKVSSVSFRVVIREAVTLDNVCGALRLRAMRWLYPQADAVIVLSSFMVKELINKIGVPSSNIHCISNPVDNVFVNEQGRIPIEHRWLDKEKYKVVISVGRLILQKDFATLIRAFALLPRKLSARLIILGEGAEREMLEQLAMDLGIADIAQFIGFDANPWRWMARADLFVLPSRWEGHPNVLLEALALDLPVVATEYDISVLELAADHGFVVVPSGDSVVLAGAIEEQLHVNDRKKKYCISTVGVKNVAADYLITLGA